MDLLTHIHPTPHPPSFSSTLLDAIYRSIDDSGNASQSDHHQRLNIFYTHAAAMNNASHKLASHEPPRTKKSIPHYPSSLTFFNATSTSSDSSTAGFSSSESDSFYTTARSTSSSPTYSTTLRRPNPIRTTTTTTAAVSGPPDKSRHVMMDTVSTGHKSKSDHKREDGGFVRTKSKAFKLYSDLKKAKQPISPGGRFATFLNSLFTPGNAKKMQKISSSSTNDQASTCSSASSFSRSCLSKTPSSRAKSNSNGTKRSVRFCPVSVIVDEDCRPCGNKSLYNQTQFITKVETETSDERIDRDQWRVMEENRRVVQAAKDLLKSYRKKKGELDMRDIMSHQNQVCYDDVEDEEEEDDDDDDAASCSSSDLFELDNLSAIGIERYSEELPVYETTNLGTNRAIANGLIL